MIMGNCAVALAESHGDVTEEVLVDNDDGDVYDSVKVSVKETSETEEGPEAVSTKEGTNTSVTVKTNVSLDSSGRGTGVRADSYGDSISSTVNVGNDISVEAKSDATGIEAVSIHDSTTTVTVGNDVSAKAEGDAKGVYAFSGDGSTTTMTVGNDVSAEAGGKAYGIDAEPFKESTTTVNVNNNVSATAKEYAAGVYVDSLFGGDTTIDKVNNISATSSEGFATGIHTRSDSESEDSDGDSVVSVTTSGDVTVEGKMFASGIESSTYSSDTTDINIGGGIYVNGDNNATGINTTGNGNTKITIGTNIDVDGFYSNGIYAYGNSTISVGNDINANGTMTQGLLLGTGSGETNITIANDINSVASGDDYASAYGISGHLGTGDVSVTVGGNVTAKGSLKDGNDSSSAEGITIWGSNGGNIDISVGGNVVQDAENGRAISLTDSYNDSSNDTLAPVITVSVAKDVTASDTAIDITKNRKDSTIGVTVGGTVTGDEHSIVIDEDTKTDNVNITVWKVDTSNNQPIVEAISFPNKTDSSLSYDVDPGDPEYTTNETTEKIEKSINYIIRVQSDVAISSGTRKINGYDTAHQEETVTLAVTVPSGYEIENFYNVSPGNIIGLSKGSSEGTYLLVVPRGGGVDVGVSLKKVNATPTSGVRESDNDDSSSSSDGSPNTNTNTNNYSWSAQDPTAVAAVIASLPPIHVANFAGTENVVNVADILTPVDTLTAINNFAASGAGNLGTANVMGAGIVSFNNVFATSISDTVDVPVVANVMNGMTYTVMFSDGTSLTVPCLMDGLLTIPFNKNAAGLTYIIYGMQMNPAMMIGADTTTQFPDGLAGLTP